MLVGLTLASIPASDRENSVSLSLIENRKQLGLEIDLPSDDWIGVQTSLVPPVRFGIVHGRFLDFGKRRGGLLFAFRHVLDFATIRSHCLNVLAVV